MRTRRSTPPPATILVALTALLTLGCFGHAVPVDGAPPEENTYSGQSINDVVATLIVENSRMVDYRIYLTRQGGERLGIVRGPGKATFLLRGAQMPHTGEMRVIAVPIAAREVLSSSAVVPRGHTARFVILPGDVYVTVDPLPLPADTTTTADTTKKPR